MTVPLSLLASTHLSTTYRDQVRELDLCGIWRVPLDREKVLDTLRQIY